MERLLEGDLGVEDRLLDRLRGLLPRLLLVLRISPDSGEEARLTMVSSNWALASLQGSNAVGQKLNAVQYGHGIIKYCHVVIIGTITSWLRSNEVINGIFILHCTIMSCIMFNEATNGRDWNYLR